jgi:L-alanine-DL-glutamate epimerase-like enolase superfamily enzyme
MLTNKPGLAGYSEVYTLGIPFSPAVLQTMVRDFGEKLAVGENPYHIESLFQRGYAYGYSHHAARRPGWGYELNESAVRRYAL